MLLVASINMIQDKIYINRYIKEACTIKTNYKKYIAQKLIGTKKAAESYSPCL